MAHFDLPLDQLRAYRSSATAPADFDDFWARTLAESRAAGWEPRLERVDAGLELVDVHDVTFAGFGGDAIRAWWQAPADRAPKAVVVELVGYSGGRGFAHDTGPYPLAGYARLVVDTRGQGWSHGSAGGATADPHGTGSQAPGVMTRGIGSRETYYYRRAYTDSALAVDVARKLAPGVAVFVAGTSQGGGLAIAAAALADDVAGALPDVPFLCDFPRATTLVDTMPYGEIRMYLAAHRDEVESVYRTLSYFDGVGLAARATAPAVFSTALMDATCPPSTVFGAFNAWAGEDKSIEVYPFNGHEGGTGYQREAQLRWLRERVG
ncbi:acetylxylan esterase [Microbacterium betulae]|uniref:Acetylxylan esterase n=1 Tax=Microbacterium betulae TaxID=2981139 RepID=A0AA97I7I3_9MICO|nr:acetylxylan esterase [Microbacterium sp. AB]WOF24297.1 acetylxylan esterase [Microbacterium sp. AB]